MRLIVGYYDLPENRNKPKPPPPTHVTINNVQTLKFTNDVDPYYKLALLSYRSKLANLEILKVNAVDSFCCILMIHALNCNICRGCRGKDELCSTGPAAISGHC